MFSLSERQHLRFSAWFPAWFRERIVTGFWWLVPLSLVISLAGGWRFWFFRAAMAMFALVMFRLWDDLEDVEHDRLRHPKRVLCKTASLSQAYGFCAAGLAMSCAFIAAAGDRWLVFVAALILVFVASRVRRRRNDSALRVVFAHAILLKVPALVIALAPDEIPNDVIGARVLALLGFVGAYEVLHDAEARRSPFTPFLFTMDMVCLLLGLAVGIIKETRT